MAEHETIADIIAEMRKLAHEFEDYGGMSIPAMLLDFSDHLEAAHKRELARVDAVIDEAVHGYPPEDINDRRERGNAAKLREALRSCLDTICRIVWIDDPEYDEDGHYLGANYAAVSRDKARAALDAPPRNCDVGTADDWLAQFNVVCERCSGSDCDHRLFKDEEVCDCFARWLQMPYVEKEGGAK